MTISYNDNLLPHKIKGEYTSTVEKKLLETETNKEIANLFIEVTSSGKEMRYVRLAKILKSLLSSKNLEGYSLLTLMCSRYHLLSELLEANRLLKCEKLYERLVNRL